MKHWNIYRVRSGMELTAHELLLEHGFQVFTPFLTKHQRLTRQQRKQRQRPRAYAEALFSGWLIVSDEGDKGIHTMSHIMQKRNYIYGAVMAADRPFQLSDEWVQKRQNGYHGQAQRSYDPKRDARKNRKKIYGQAPIEIPEFKEGETVSLTHGPFVGLDMEVQSVKDDVVKLAYAFFGRETLIEASAFDLEKIEKVA